MPLSEVIVIFPTSPTPPTGSSVCQTISIVGDNVMEEDETFTVVVVPVNHLDEITGPSSVTLTISDDSDGKDHFHIPYNHSFNLILHLYNLTDVFFLHSALAACPTLMEPENGQLDLDGVTQMSTATYSCNIGFTLNGDQTRTCGSDGSWSGSEPSCQSKSH